MPVSGVAPRAYIGNYKVLTDPDAGRRTRTATRPRSSAAIDAAVADGMDVINLSLGEPEVEPDRDIVVKRDQRRGRSAGVVPAIAAGNDFDGLRHGSISSPGDATKCDHGRGRDQDSVIADFSSARTQRDRLGLKPDVSAPGVNIYSSVPSGWDDASAGRAWPHRMSPAALRYCCSSIPTWTPAQIKSALVLTGHPVWTDGTHRHEVAPTRVKAAV